MYFLSDFHEKRRNRQIIVSEDRGNKPCLGRVFHGGDLFFGLRAQQQRVLAVLPDGAGDGAFCGQKMGKLAFAQRNGTVEFHADSAVFRRAGNGRGGMRIAGLSVDVLHGEGVQALGHGNLLQGMDVLLVADVAEDSHRHAGQLRALRLLQAQRVPVEGSPHGGIEGGQLAGEEGQLRVVPRLLPAFAHPRKQGCIALRLAGVGVALALIPQRAADAEGRDPGDHVLEQTAGLVRISDGALRVVNQTALKGAVMGGAVQRFFDEIVHVDLHVADGGLKAFEVCLRLFAEGIAQRGVKAEILAGVLVGEEGFGRNPALNLRAAPVAVDDAHGHVQRLRQQRGEVIADGGEAGDAAAVGQRPAGFGAVHRIEVPAVLGNVLTAAGDGLQAHVGINRRLGQSAAAGDAHHGHLHVGLSAGQPDLAGGDVFKGDGFIAAADFEGGDDARRGRVDAGHPFALRVGDALRTGVAQRDFHLCPGGRSAPDGIRAAVAQHHMAGKHFGNGEAVHKNPPSR